MKSKMVAEITEHSPDGDVTEKAGQEMRGMLTEHANKLLESFLPAIEGYWAVSPYSFDYEWSKKGKIKSVRAVMLRVLLVDKQARELVDFGLVTLRLNDTLTIIPDDQEPVKLNVELLP